MSDDAHESPRRRGLWWKVPLGLFALALLFGFIAHSVWTGNERAGAQRRVAAVRALGEPIDPRDLSEPNVPDAQNRAVAIRAAVAALVEPEDRKDRRDAIERADPNAFAVPMAADELALLRAHVADNKAALAALAGIDARPMTAWGDLAPATPVPGGPPPTPRMFGNLPALNQTRAAANLLRDAARVAAADGDAGAAIARLREADAVGEAANAEQMLIASLVATGCEALAADATSELAPTLSPLAPADRAAALRWIATLLDDAGVERQWRAGLLGERVAGHELFEAAAAGTSSFSSMGAPAPAGGAPPAGQRVAAWAMAPIVYAGDATMLDFYAAVLPLLDAPSLADYGERAKATVVPIERATQASKRTILASILMPSFGRMADTRYRLLTTRHLAAATLAARLYALDHDGQQPPTLDALVPAYLASVPTDAIDGKPLRYDPRRAIVWGVGEDKGDDGGDETLRRPQYGRDLWQMRDAVVHLAPQTRPATQPSDGN